MKKKKKSFLRKVSPDKRVIIVILSTGAIGCFVIGVLSAIQAPDEFSGWLAAFAMTGVFSLMTWGLLKNKV